MSRSLLITLLLNTWAVLSIAGSSNTKTLSPEQKEQARQWMQNQPVKFLENKGQMADMEGKLVPFVLYKASAPGIDMYVTEKGLTYVFVKVEEEIAHPCPPEGREDSSPLGRLGGAENIQIEWCRIDMELKGANIKKENILKETPSVADFNYFYPHCSEGIYGVKQYEKITITNIYRNIDWVLYNAEEKGFKYDFIVHPGADPAQIKLLYRSKENLHLNNEGNIEIKTLLGTITENAPVSYLQESGTKIASRFTKKIIDEHSTEVTFKLSNFELSNSQTLVIDPQLVWGTFYGGNWLDGFMSADCDINGNVYVTGYTNSANFPTQTWGSAYFNGIGFGPVTVDAFILRFSNTGVLNWATYYGGSGNDYGNSITINAMGNIYVTGETDSGNLPTQLGTGTFTGAYYDNTLGGALGLQDIFVLRFSPAGNLEWATYYGGSNVEGGYSITTDVTGNVYITGYAGTNFPCVSWGTAYYDNALGGFRDAFMLRFSNAGILDWATYYGGGNWENSYAITSDALGNIYVTGETYSSDFPTQTGVGVFTGAYYDPGLNGTSDVFILRFSTTGGCDWATYYGGDSTDVGYSIGTDITGNIYITGKTESNNFFTQPSVNGYYDGTLGGTSDAFILRFSATGTCNWATYYGGSGVEYKFSPSYDNIAIGSCGNIYVSFETTSTDIQTLNPGCSSYYDGTYAGSGLYSAGDNFLAEFSSSGQLLWATYIGASQDDFRGVLALDTNNNLYLCGEWDNYISSAGLPVMNSGGGAYYDNIPDIQDNSFIMKFIPIQPTYMQAQINPICTCNGSATVNVSCAITPVNYLWNNGSSILNTTNLSNTISNLCPGNYWVEVTDASCNKDTLFYVLTGSGGLLTLNTNVTNILCNAGNNGIATITVSTGTSPYTYVWSNAQTTSAATGLSAGTYTAIVTDAKGCTNNVSVIVSEIPCPCPTILNLTLPNAFSPNSDGENDMLQIYYADIRCIKTLMLIIYDRWGEKVFATNDPAFKWDGTFKGKVMNTAVFAYYMDAALTNGEQITKRGNVSLIK